MLTKPWLWFLVWHPNFTFNIFLIVKASVGAFKKDNPWNLREGSLTALPGPVSRCSVSGWLTMYLSGDNHLRMSGDHGGDTIAISAEHYLWHSLHAYLRPADCPHQPGPHCVKLGYNVCCNNRLRPCCYLASSRWRGGWQRSVPAHAPPPELLMVIFTLTSTEPILSQ